jgi:hypothetical protein
MTTTTTKALRLRWLRFKRHLGDGPTRRAYAAAPYHAIRSSADHGTRGIASSANMALPRTLPGRQTWRGPVFALLALSLLALASVAQAG